MSVIGWRWWDLSAGKKGGQLMSVNDVAWDPLEPVEAECLFGDVKHPGVSAPVAGCHCGLWAFTDPEIAEGLIHQQTYLSRCKVFGVVEMWGKMQEHRYGYRAQWAQVKAVVVMRGRMHPLYFDTSQEGHVQRFSKVADMVRVWDEEYNR